MTWFFLATCSAVLSAVSAILQKKVLFRLNALEFSFLVSAAILISSLFVPFMVDITAISSPALLILIGKSVLGGLAFLMVMKSLELNQISSALPLLGTTPAITALLAIPILGELLHGFEWLGIVMMVIGTYLLEKKPSQIFWRSFNNFISSKNHHYIFYAVILFAISSIADKSLLSDFKTDPLIVLFYQHLIYSAVFGVFIIIRGFSFRAIAEKGRAQFLFIVSIAILTIGYRFTQLEATQLAPVALVLAVKRTSILYASFFGGKLFSDERLPQKLLGGTLIVAAGFIILRYVV